MPQVQHQEVTQGRASPTNRYFGATKQCSTPVVLEESEYHSIANCLDNQTISLTECSMMKVGQTGIEDRFIPCKIEEIGALLTDCELSPFNDQNKLLDFVEQAMGDTTQVDSLDCYLSSVNQNIGKELSVFELELQKTFVAANLPYTEEDFYVVTIKNDDLYTCQSDDLAFRIESVGLLNFFRYNIDLLSAPYRELVALLILTLNKFGKMNIIAQDEYSFIDQLTEVVSNIPTKELITLSKLSDSLRSHRYLNEPVESEAIKIDAIIKRLNNIDKEIIEVLLEWHDEIAPLALEDFFSKVHESLERAEHTAIYDVLDANLLHTDHLSYLSKLIENIASTTTVQQKVDAKLFLFVQSTLPVLEKYFVSTDCKLVIDSDNSGDAALGYDIQFVGSGCGFEEASCDSVYQYMMEVGEVPMDGVRIGHEMFFPLLKQIAVTVQVLFGLQNLQ